MSKHRHHALPSSPSERSSWRALDRQLRRRCPPRVRLERDIKAPVIVSIERLSRQLGRSQAATRRLVRERGVLTVRRGGRTFALTESAADKLAPELCRAGDADD